MSEADFYEQLRAADGAVDAIREGRPLTLPDISQEEAARFLDELENTEYPPAPIVPAVPAGRQIMPRPPRDLALTLAELFGHTNPQSSVAVYVEGIAGPIAGPDFIFRIEWDEVKIEELEVVEIAPAWMGGGPSSIGLEIKTRRRRQ